MSNFWYFVWLAVLVLCWIAILALAVANLMESRSRRKRRERQAALLVMQQDGYNLFIRGLIPALPPVDSEWSQADWQKWLKQALEAGAAAGRAREQRAVAEARMRGRSDLE